MKVNVLIANIDQGAIALPQFQRGYVWSRAQVRGLMGALYRGHPVGSLLTWLTASDSADYKGETSPQPGSVQLLLDGQQRVTTLYGIITGSPPPFFEGDARAFTDLRFHLEDEVFEFWQPVKMRDDPLWLDVTEFYRKGPGVAIGELAAEHKDDPRFPVWINRLNQLGEIASRDFYIDQVAGADKTVDVVVDIFNRVNSGGTKLSKGDLALAKLCAEWPEARIEMREMLDEWAAKGFGGFSLDWLLRVATAILTGRSRFVFLSEVTPEQFSDALKRSKKAIDTVLNALGGRLGINDGSVLPSTFAMVPLARFVDLSGGTLGDYQQRDRLLYWYLHAAMWGRYASATESKLAQDLAVITAGEDPTDRLLVFVKQQRGNLTVNPGDFWGQSRGARFYPILYVMTRMTGARDWGTGVPLSKSTLGSHTDLEVHHIFPKSLLYEAGYSRGDVNAIANFTFLTKQTNGEISNQLPTVYLPAYSAKHPAVGDAPGAVEEHWVPMEPALWELTAYPQFLERRRVLLAQALNTLLDELYGGTVPEVEVAPASAVGDPQEDEAAIIADLRAWLAEQRLDQGIVGHEMPAADGTPIGVLAIAWPAGVQHGLSEPVALMLNEPADVVAAAFDYGYKVFTSVEPFREHCEMVALIGSIAVEE